MIVTIVCAGLLGLCVGFFITYAIVAGGTRKEMPEPPMMVNMVKAEKALSFSDRRMIGKWRSLGYEREVSIFLRSGEEDRHRMRNWLPELQE